MSFTQPPVTDTGWVPAAQGFDRIVEVSPQLRATMLVRRLPVPGLKACVITVEIGDLRHTSIVHQDHPDEDWGSISEGAILNAERAFEGLVMQRLINLQSMLEAVGGDDIITRLLSDERPTFNVLVNGAAAQMRGYYVARETLLSALGLELDDATTITYAQPDGSRHSQMLAGCAVRLAEGMTFTVTTEEAHP